ncbi:SDR family NAD(P)-dependent oxidoreductase [Paenibacillus sp. GCM10027626]|uniref:SDR family NAD(P)-dependent oxidoreductase n=1 Tax=Paenibacillus sp. GCM10027626 TaxID=3273411 RepID=UPI003631D9E1
MRALEEKVILITGCMGAAGSAAAAAFIEKGAIVYGCDLHPEERHPEFAQLRQRYDEDRWVYRQSDVSDEAQVSSMLADIERRFGKIDGSYHLAFKNVEQPITELSLADWDASIRGTLTSTFLVCKHVVSLMIRGNGGSIVNTSSVLGQNPSSGCYAYGAAKAGVNQFTRVLAKDYAKHGIRANVIVPGDFRSEQSLQMQTEREKEAIRHHALLGRSGSANEINEVAAFLLSDAASYVTGSLYAVDGGFRL